MPHEGVATPVGEGGRNPGWGRGPDPSKGTGCDPIRRRASRYMLGARPQLGEGVVTPIGEVGRDPGKGWGSRPQLGKGDPVPIRVGGRDPRHGKKNKTALTVSRRLRSLSLLAFCESVLASDLRRFLPTPTPWTPRDIICNTRMKRERGASVGHSLPRLSRPCRHLPSVSLPFSLIPDAIRHESSTMMEEDRR